MKDIKNSMKRKSKANLWIFACVILLGILAVLYLFSNSAKEDNSTVTDHQGEVTDTNASEKEYSALTEQEYKITAGKDIIYHFLPNGTLKVTGTGAIQSFDTVEDMQEYFCSRLYQQYMKQNKTATVKQQEFMSVLLSVERIEVTEGVTEISRGAFSTFYNATSVSVAKSVKSVDETAFLGTGQYAEQTEWSGLEPYGILTEDVASDTELPPKEEWDVPYPKEEELVKTVLFGDEIQYKLYSDGTLKVSGKGETYDFRMYTEIYDYIKEALEYTSWNEVDSFWFERINTIIIEEGVTVIGEYALAGCKNVSAVYVCADLSEIKEGAFINLGIDTDSDIQWMVDLKQTECSDKAFINCKNAPEGVAETAKESETT